MDLISVKSEINFRIRSVVLIPKSNITLCYAFGVLPMLASLHDHDGVRVSAKPNKELVDQHDGSSLYRF
jgi:hypothetical protein